MWRWLTSWLRPSPRKSSIEWNDNVITLTISKEYDIEKVSEIMALYNSEEIERATNIVINISELTTVNVMGLEMLMLKEKLANQSRYSVVFCGLKPEIKLIFEALGAEKAFGELVNFNSIDEALGFLSSRQQL